MEDSRIFQAAREVRLVAEALADAAPERRDRLLLRLARDTGARIRLYDDDGDEIADSRDLGLENFRLIAPDKEPWQQKPARYLNALTAHVVGAARAPPYRETQSGQDCTEVSTTH